MEKNGDFTEAYYSILLFNIEVLMKIVLFILLFFITLNAQEYLTGNLKTDTEISFNETYQHSLNGNYSVNEKSPFLAGAMSLLLPGSGEFYTENYLKAGIFLAVEALAIYFKVDYDNRGDEQTEFYEDYAHAHWSVEKYAKWTLNNLNNLEPGVNPSDYQVFDGNGNVNWDELNRLETAIGIFSHQLESFGEQQYYEMIGKYKQFASGWDDFGDENTSFNLETDPVSSNFTYYATERGKANDYYNIARTAVIVIVTNHIASAIDAAWSAFRYNNNIKISAEIKKFQIGYFNDYYPQLNLSLRF